MLESVTLEAQAESPPTGFKPPLPEAFKGSMDGENILNFKD